MGRHTQSSNCEICGGGLKYVNFPKSCQPLTTGGGVQNKQFGGSHFSGPREVGGLGGLTALGVLKSDPPGQFSTVRWGEGLKKGGGGFNLPDPPGNSSTGCTTSSGCKTNCRPLQLVDKL